MSTKLSPARAAQFSPERLAVIDERVFRDRRLRERPRAAGVHADQNRRRGARLARGGRNGERVALLRTAWV